MKYRRGSKKWTERKNRVTITQRVEALQTRLFGINKAEYALWRCNCDSETLVLTKEMLERAVMSARMQACDDIMKEIMRMKFITTVDKK